jgi:hypothetical protein
VEKSRTVVDATSIERRHLPRIEQSKQKAAEDPVLSSDYGWANRRFAFGFDVEIIGSKDHLVSKAGLDSNSKHREDCLSDVSNARDLHCTS